MWLEGVTEEGVKKETRFLGSLTVTLRELGTTEDSKQTSSQCFNLHF